MKIEEISALFSVVSKKGKIFTVKQSYYYGFTSSGESLWKKVKAKIPQAQLIGYGNHYHDWVGDAKPGSAKDSYLWVKFIVERGGEIICTDA